jgi:hypothetical protein
MNVSVNAPSFLHGFAVTELNQAEWHTIILPHISTFIFKISSTTDLHYFANMLASRQLESMYRAITKIDLPAFFWFSGISHTRRANPYFEMTSTLPALEEMSLRLHTAGITTSRFTERQMVALEATDPGRARERKVMLVEEVVRKYELDAIFACRRLCHVRVEYVACERIRFFTRVGDPVHLLREVQMYLVNGCALHGLDVFVELVRVG